MIWTVSGMIFVTNAPTFFSVIWSFCKLLMEWVHDALSFYLSSSRTVAYTNTHTHPLDLSQTHTCTYTFSFSPHSERTRKKVHVLSAAQTEKLWEFVDKDQVYFVMKRVCTKSSESWRAQISDEFYRPPSHKHTQRFRASWGVRASARGVRGGACITRTRDRGGTPKSWPELNWMNEGWSFFIYFASFLEICWAFCWKRSYFLSNCHAYSCPAAFSCAFLWCLFLLALFRTCTNTPLLKVRSSFVGFDLKRNFVEFRI